MALPIGKLTIIIGAGIVGSVLAKEGSIPTVSDIFSGAFKVFWKQIRHDDSKATPSRPKLRNDSLLQQVNSLRQELQLLASNRSVTIVTSGGSGFAAIALSFPLVFDGFKQIWYSGCGHCGWMRLYLVEGESHASLTSLVESLTKKCTYFGVHHKGWKLPDMMFASRRSLSGASAAVTKQLENVYTSIAATKRHLSSRIDRVDCNLDECAELTTATREEVSELRGEVKVTCVDVQSVHHAVRTLETKIHRIEGKQDSTNEGVKKLVYAAWNLENSRAPERIQAAPSSSSRPALEMAQMTPSSGTESPSPIPSVDLPSPSASNGTTKRPLQNTVSASGLKELHGISPDVDALTSPGASIGINATGDTNNGNSGPRMLGRTISGISASLITRTRSAMQSFK